MQPLRAGFARTDITPPIGVPLTGFIARTSPSTGIDAPLSASTLFIANQNIRAVIAAIDVLGITHEAAESLTRELATIAGCEPGQVIIASSHTHSGPRSMPLRGIGDPEPAVMAQIRRGLIDSCKSAVASAAPVRASWSHSPIKLGQNRREKTAAGIVLGHKSNGPCDANVTTLFLTSDLPGRRPIALFAHACHPYCLGAGSTLISADFCGHAVNALDTHGFDSLFINGCAGDIAPVQCRPDNHAALQEGQRLAAAVLAAYPNREDQPEATLSCDSAWIDLPHAPLEPLAQIRASVAEGIRINRSNPNANQLVVEACANAWTDWLAALEKTAVNSPLPPVPARVSLLRLGNGAIAALPGEIFFETGQAIAARIHSRHFIASCYCHGYTGYAPTPEAHRDGGYEVDDAHKFLGLWKLDESVPQLLENTISSLAIKP